MVSKINSLEADLVLFAGDIIDRNMDTYKNENLNEELSRIKAAMGVYAVAGNHDYFWGNIGELEKELATAGVRLLVDEAVSVDGAFYLIGRNDFSRSRWGVGRKSLKELASGLDASLPLIAMDHQPRNLNEAEEAGIDLHVSGHTHRGQIWPGNAVVKRLFENSYGLLHKGKTAFVVTSGFGTWGPPLRIGSRAEIVLIELKNPEENI
jgi:predicted MPP superfamily phosphohydrolase